MAIGGREGGRADTDRLRRIGVWALYATLLAPLVFSSRTIYPYVLSRSLFFRVAVALAAGIAAYLVLTRGRSRSPRDPVLLGLLVFLGVELVAGVAGVAVWRSVFGDLERLGGALWWAHLVAFYAALRALPTEEELRSLFRVAVVVGCVVGLIALLQTAGVRIWVLPRVGTGRAASTLGNAGYLGAYALVTMAVCALCLSWSKGAWRGVAGFALVVGAVALGMTFTRAALLGLGAGVVTGLFAYGTTATARRARIWSLSAGGVLVLLGLAVSSAALDRIPIPGIGAIAGRFGDVSLDTYGLQTRMSVWRAGFRSLEATPLHGVGPENFRVAFDRNFDPTHYEIDPAETHYTRAHNAFLGTFVTSGIPGGLAYLAVWLALLYAALAGWREGALSATELAIIGGAFVGYGVYLLFWFEDRNSFPLLLAIAAFVAHRRAGGPIIRPPAAPARFPAGVARGVVAVVVLALGLADAWHHARVWETGHRLVQAVSSRGLLERFDRYEEGLRARPGGAEEAVTEFVQFLVSVPQRLDGRDIDERVAREVGVAFAECSAALDTLIERDPYNPRLRRDAGQLYVASYLLTRRAVHLERAIRHLEAAVALAPGRIRYRQMLSEVYLMAERPERAVEVMHDALEVWDRLGETHYFAAKALLIAEKPGEGAEALERAYALGYRPASPAVAQGLYRALLDAGQEEAAERLRGVVEGSG